MRTIPREQEHVDALLRLTLSSADADAVTHVASLSLIEREDLLDLADAHHVVIRALAPVRQAAGDTGLRDLHQWTSEVIAAEQQRILNALAQLAEITAELERAGCPIAVIKSLDHTPDLGNDLDLFTTAEGRKVVKVMVQRFQAHVEPRSWGDRLANKWNFTVPGLKEAIEVHAKRLGQTGEHVRLARRFVTRRVPRTVVGHTFMVPAPEERLIVATLQRMYRHFYFRVCDIVNTAGLVESGELDFAELRKAGERAGIWPGVATLLVIVSDYMARYRGGPLALPPEVRRAARFGGTKLDVRGKFIRVPMMPEGAALYSTQLARTALRGNLPAAFRLTLLPPLATAAALAYKFTGNDKGIW